MSKADALRRVPLLSGLSAKQLDTVVNSSNIIRHSKGSVVFNEGDPGDFLLIVLSGRVKVVLFGAKGTETIIAILEPPDFLGEVALIDHAPRSATVVAVEETEFLQITRDRFLALIKDDPEIALRVMAHLAKTLRDSHQQIRTLSMPDACDRVMEYLIALARERGTGDGQRIIITPLAKHEELGRMIGCARETVTRSLTLLRNAGFISPVKGGVAIEQKAIRRYLDF
jgi:CRP/FNR family transcriptional regulator, cyclic AMP receptor protein